MKPSHKWCRKFGLAVYFYVDDGGYNFETGSRSIGFKKSQDTSTCKQRAISCSLSVLIDDLSFSILLIAPAVMPSRFASSCCLIFFSSLHFLMFEPIGLLLPCGESLTAFIAIVIIRCENIFYKQSPVGENTEIFGEKGPPVLDSQH